MRNAIDCLIAYRGTLQPSSILPLIGLVVLSPCGRTENSRIVPELCCHHLEALPESGKNPFPGSLASFVDE